jgi:hypothetical protein
MDVVVKLSALRFSVAVTVCGLVVRVPGCYPRSSGLIPGATRFSGWQWVWNGVHSALVRVNEELLEGKVAAPF